jgi:methylmalonyl-CoA mutase C-terminal domain/subunit
MRQNAENKIRILDAKPGIDGHDRGAKVLCIAFRDAGMEVIYTGLHQTADMIVKSAIAEDVDVIAISCLDGSHMYYFSEVTNLLKQRGADNICVVGGGTIPEKDKPSAEKIGVTGLYGTGTPLPVIVDHIRERVRKQR